MNQNYKQYYCVLHFGEILQKIAKRLLTPIWHVIPLRHNNPIWKEEMSWMNLSATCCLKRSLLKKMPYYLNWVTKFHEFCNIKPETPITSENIDRYLNKLSSIYEPWQIQQASDAVSLWRWTPMLGQPERKISSKPAYWKRGIRQPQQMDEEVRNMPTESLAHYLKIAI